MGDPQMLAGDSVVLLVHASLEGAGGPSRLLYTIRPFRHSAGDAAALFGTTPRAVPPDEAEAALRASLAEILPWITGQDAPKPL